MTLPLDVIDAFADAPFTGNPAGVVLLDSPRPSAWMQQVAMEMNQAETAFLHREGDGFSLRWFTPAKEVDLCGHATLASAHYLWEHGHLDRSVAARFNTRSGWLTAEAGPDGTITLDFPAISPEPAEPPADLARAIGVAPDLVLRGSTDLICVVRTGELVRNLTPDSAAIAQWDARGVIVTAPGDRPGIDFTSRCFFPAYGIPEDPVTGSAHCALAVYWSGVLRKTTVVGYQASSRGGTVHCEVTGERVRLTGRAMTIVRGQLQA